MAAHYHDGDQQRLYASPRLTSRSPIAKNTPSSLCMKRGLAQDVAGWNSQAPPASESDFYLDLASVTAAPTQVRLAHSSTRPTLRPAASMSSMAGFALESRNPSLNSLAAFDTQASARFDTPPNAPDAFELKALLNAFCLS